MTFFTEKLQSTLGRIFLKVSAEKKMFTENILQGAMTGIFQRI